MMRKTLLIGSLCIFFMQIVNAQKINLNRNWLFQRLDATVENYTIENQGTSWESQFNVMHTAVSAQLEVPADTLKAEFAQIGLGSWQEVALPHTPKYEDLVVLNQWQGICYYKKYIEVDPSWQGKQVWIEFEGAMQLADVWVNGKHLTQHAGGYTPFLVDLSEEFADREKIELLVRLDNRDNPLIPPGKPLSKLDFCYYGGLYRGVNLIVKSADTFITNPIMANTVGGGGVFVTYSDVSKEMATVNVQTNLANVSVDSKELILKQTLFEMKGLFTGHKRGRKIAIQREEISLAGLNSVHYDQKIKVDNPKLWHPNHPHLYLLVTEVLSGNKVIDQQETRIGIRHLAFSKAEGFVLNGEPLRLVGANRHMEYPYVGNAISDNAQYRDIYQIKENGFNLVRLGHYPQTTSTLEACDELGVLAIEPMPGWQFFNKNPLFLDLTFRDIQDMIRRDRNHPSVVMWETILNESWPPKEWRDQAVATAHAEFPNNQCFTSGDGYGYDGFDVVYNDWEEGYKRPTPGTKAGFIREYYDYEFGGHYSSTRIGRADGEKALIQNAWNAQWSHNRYRKQYPSTSGDAVWSMYDYNRGCCDNICESGVADVFRLPKFSLDFYKSQLAIHTPLPSGKMAPSLFIANYWTSRDESEREVLIYGNVDEVELLVNGVSVARQTKDKGVDTEYVEFPDGGNCNQLTQAPFTFRNIDWKRGKIEAIGYVNSKKVANTVHLTPESPSKIAIRYFESGKEMSQNDVVLVYVELLDHNGTLCVLEDDTIELQVSEGHEIVGPQKVKVSAGIASFVVKTGFAKNIKLVAYSKYGSAAKHFTLKAH